MKNNINEIALQDKYKIKFTAIPVSCLEDIKSDIDKFKQSYELNNFQQWIVNERYITEINGADFNVQSIVVAVSGYHLFKAIFNHNGKQVTDTIGYPAFDLKKYMIDIFCDHGYKLDYVHWMPQKRLAVRSGMVEYGKNNICYDNDFGSFIELATFISDIPANEYIWRDVENSHNCDDCSLCFNNCPTGAMTSDRFLIDTDKCLAAINEWGTHDFADWIPTTVHHRLVGCLRCQDICPMNTTALQNITDSLEFNESETEMILSGSKIDDLPDSLTDKVNRLHVQFAWDSIPRNLRAMFNNPQITTIFR